MNFRAKSYLVVGQSLEAVAVMGWWGRSFAYSQDVVQLVLERSSVVTDKLRYLRDLEMSAFF